MSREPENPFHAQTAEELTQLNEDYTLLKTAIDHVSGALCDSGAVVPEDPRRYGDAVRWISAKAKRLEKENKVQREALELAGRWLGLGNEIETFEDIGSWFRQETGFMRPGKDESVAVNSDPEARRAAWDKWTTSRGEYVRGTIRLALNPKTGSETP